MQKIYLSNDYEGKKVRPIDLEVEEVDGEVKFFDATSRLSKFFILYANEDCSENISAQLDVFLEKLRGAKKVTFVDTVFVHETMKFFCDNFGFEMIAPKGIFGQVEKFERIRTRETLPLFMKKVLEKQKRVAAVFLAAEDVKLIVEMLRKVDFPLNLMKMYLKGDATDLVARKDFLDVKVLIFTLDACWGAPLEERFDTVFGFFGGTKAKALTWQVTKIFRKFGNAKKYVYAL